jgi:hypothetical protein
MGAKTALLAIVDGDAPTALRSARWSGPEETAALVQRVHPGHRIQHIEESVLGDVAYPPDGTTHAGTAPGIDILCDVRLMLERPSRLPRHMVDLAGGRRIVHHAMHSVSDWAAFAVWESGELIRSFSASPDGVVEDIGAPLAFEEPFWDTVLPDGFLDLGEEALRALFGFVREGVPQPQDIDEYEIPLHGFRVSQAGPANWP